MGVPKILPFGTVVLTLSTLFNKRQMTVFIKSQLKQCAAK